MQFKSTLVAGVVAAGALLVPAQSAHSADKVITFGTGGIVGV
jgi:hypothetical protein